MNENLRKLFFVFVAICINELQAQECPSNSVRLGTVHYGTSTVKEVGAGTAKQKQCERVCDAQNRNNRFGDFLSARYQGSDCVCIYCDYIGASRKEVTIGAVEQNNYRKIGTGRRPFSGALCAATRRQYQYFTHPSFCPDGSDHNQCIEQCQKTFGDMVVDASCEDPRTCTCLLCDILTGPASSRASQRENRHDQFSLCEGLPETKSYRIAAGCDQEACERKCIGPKIYENPVTPGQIRLYDRQRSLTAAYCVGQYCICEKCNRPLLVKSDKNVLLSQGCTDSRFEFYKAPACTSDNRCRATCDDAAKAGTARDVLGAACSSDRECACETCIR